MSTLSALIDRLKRSTPPWKDILEYMEKNPSFLMFGPAQIAGTWYYVNPLTGADNNDGLSVLTALKTLSAAYAKCGDGTGDGIVLLSAGTGASASTTSYLSATLAWTKSGITVIGVASGTRKANRARIASQEITSLDSAGMSQTAHSITRDDGGSFINDGWVIGMTGYLKDSGGNNGATFTVTNVTALTLTISETFSVVSKATSASCTLTSYLATVIALSGTNNSFFNVHIGNYGSQVGSLGAVKVTGARNYFDRCHLYGAANAVPAAQTGAYDLSIGNGASECTFERCTFGSDTIIRAATNGNIRFDGTAAASAPSRIAFYDCDILCWTATSTKGAILSSGIYSFQGVVTFSRCRFMSWSPNGITAIASAFIGTKPDSGIVLIDSCSLVGWAAWDSVSEAVMYVANSSSQASAGGGIATHT